jgi:hypothetical protein
MIDDNRRERFALDVVEIIPQGSPSDPFGHRRLAGFRQDAASFRLRLQTR